MQSQACKEPAALGQGGGRGEGLDKRTRKDRRPKGWKSGEMRAEEVGLGRP